MKEFVLDNSIVMSWFFEDECSLQSEKILQRLKTQRAIVPSLWAYELSNALFISENKRKLATNDSKQFIDLLSKLPIFIESNEPFQFANRVLPICRKYAVTAYDAAYLDLADIKRIPIATFDKKMRATAKKMKIETID